MTTSPRYRVLVGINYPPDERRAEPGDIVDDIPDYAQHKLEQAGAIERVQGGRK